MSGAETISKVAIEYAKLWKAHNCHESDNESSCFQYLFDNKYESVSGNPWCAATVSAILADAYSRLGVQNPFHWTLSAWNLYEQASELESLRVDDAPTPGCVFVYPKTNTESSHTGIVVGVTTSGLFTVEGNSGDALKCYGCPDNGIVVVGNSLLRSHRQMKLRSTVYLHTEEYGEAQYAGVGSVWPSALLLASAALGVWYYST